MTKKPSTHLSTEKVNELGGYLQLEKAAVRLGIHTIDLFVTDANQPAVKLYKQSGSQTERKYLKKSV